MSIPHPNLSLDNFEKNHAMLLPFADAARGSLLPTILTDALIADNPVVFANDAFLAMIGNSREAVIGRPIMDLVGSTADSYVLSLFQAAIANNRNGLWQMKLARENNATFLSVAYLSPVMDENGKLISHKLNIVDLASLICISKERETIFPGIYDKAPGFIALSAGERHTIDYANAAYKDFVKCDDLIGRTVAEALPGMVEQGVIAILDEVYQTGKPFSASNKTISIWDPAQQCAAERRVDVVYQPLRDEVGKIIGLFCEGYDVTDLHEANEAIVALQMKMIHVSRITAMGTMAATLAHELNQPLTAISNYLAGARPIGGEVPDVGRITMALDGIKDASERAAGIINQVRQLTKHRKPIRELFNLREAVAECIKLMRLSCCAEIMIDNEVARDVVVNADRVMIQQVFINLMKNACEEMDDTDRARVSISAMEESGVLTVSVADNGPGIGPDAAATMFSWTETSKADGMGIGLSICRTIVERYRGNIWLQHTGPEGTDFRFSLPLPKPAKGAKDARPSPPR